MTKSTDETREQRILDAAVQLIIQFGYDKTTISEIAHEAGVSKGAVYLEYESKDDLFEALFIRELKSYAEAWLERLDADPDGGTIAAMYKNMLYAFDRNPFMAAMFRQDRRVFGKYLRKPDNFFQRESNTNSRFVFVKMMQDAGAIRQDIDPKVVAHIMNILAYGLVSMDEIMDEQDIPPMNDVIEGIGAIMDRALRPDDGGDTEAGKVIIKQIADAARQQLETTQNSAQE